MEKIFIAIVSGLLLASLLNALTAIAVVSKEGGRPTFFEIILLPWGVATVLVVLILNYLS